MATSQRLSGLLAAMTTGLVLLVAPATAAADDHILVGGLGGLTFSSQRSGDLGLRVGTDLSPTLRLNAEVQHVADMLPSAARAAIDGRAAALAAPFGDQVGATAKLGVTSATGLLRIRARQMGRMALYLEGGGGIARLNGSCELRLNDPITGSIGSSTTIPEPLFASLPSTRAILLAGTGVSIAIDRHLSVEVGYRFSRTFAGGALGAISAHRLFAAVQLGM